MVSMTTQTITGLPYALTLTAALGCGLAAGVFFAFSSFVMAGLRQLPPAEGIDAMNAINRTAVTPLFMTVLMGTALVCAVLAVRAVVTWGDRSATLVLAASVLYLAGTIGLTMARNVPLNDALAALDPHSAEAASRWSGYLGDWTAWNHVRTVTSLAATGLLIAALCA